MKKKTMITMVVIVLMLVLSIVLFAACDNDGNDSKDKKPGSETEASLHEFALENCTADKESAKAGEQVTFTADEVEGRRFVGWNIKGVDDLTGLDLTKSPLTITMPANDIVVAAQLEQLYKITVSGGCTADKEWAAEGEQVTVTKPAPKTGFATRWQTTGIVEKLDNSQHKVTFKMPANDIAINYINVRLNFYFTINNGTASGLKFNNVESVTDGRIGFDYGTDVTITANTPEIGKKFSDWTITGIDTSGLDLTASELTFKMPANKVTVTANFSDLVEHDVTVTGGVAQVGEGTLMTSLKAYCGDAVTLTAYQRTDKTFVKWTIEGIDDTTGLDLTQRILTFTMPDNDVTATAEFENVPTNLTFEGDVATSGELRYVNYDSKSFRLPLGSGQDSCTYTIELSNPAFTFKVYGSDGEVYIDDNGEGVKSITIDREDNYTIEVINTGSAANCTLTVTKV